MQPGTYCLTQNNAFATQSGHFFGCVQSVLLVTLGLHSDQSLKQLVVDHKCIDLGININSVLVLCGFWRALSGHHFQDIYGLGESKIHICTCSSLHKSPLLYRGKSICHLHVVIPLPFSYLVIKGDIYDKQITQSHRLIFFILWGDSVCRKCIIPHCICPCIGNIPVASIL